MAGGNPGVGRTLPLPRSGSERKPWPRRVGTPRRRHSRGRWRGSRAGRFADALSFRLFVGPTRLFVGPTIETNGSILLSMAGGLDEERLEQALRNEPGGARTIGRTAHDSLHRHQTTRHRENY